MYSVYSCALNDIGTSRESRLKYMDYCDLNIIIHIEWTTISSNRYLATCNFGPYFPFQQSTLLMALLGELPTQSGTSILRGRVGYTAQQAWIQNGSLRDNILFGSEYQPAKYQRVIRLCALSRVGLLLRVVDMFYCNAF